MTIDRPRAARLRLAACTATVLALVLCGCGQEKRDGLYCAVLLSVILFGKPHKTAGVCLLLWRLALPRTAPIGSKLGSKIAVRGKAPHLASWTPLEERLNPTRPSTGRRSRQPRSCPPSSCAWRRRAAGPLDHAHTERRRRVRARQRQAAAFHACPVGRGSAGRRSRACGPCGEIASSCRRHCAAS